MKYLLFILIFAPVILTAQPGPESYPKTLTGAYGAATANYMFRAGGGRPRF